eukprot:Sspe_Gene.23809::Locus_9313_Transcript_1_1_Confidence_1.000_Length_1696::g.23809::m.23809
MGAACCAPCCQDDRAEHQQIQQQLHQVHQHQQLQQSRAQRSTASLAGSVASDVDSTARGVSAGDPSHFRKAISDAMQREDISRRLAVMAEYPPTHMDSISTGCRRRQQISDTANPAFRLAWKGMTKNVICSACGAKLFKHSDSIAEGGKLPLPLKVTGMDDNTEYLCVPFDIGRTTSRPPPSNQAPGGTPAEPYATLLHSNGDLFATVEAPPAGSMKDDILLYNLRNTACWQCHCFIGFTITSVTPKSSDPTAVRKRLQQLNELTAQTPVPPDDDTPIKMTAVYPVGLTIVGLRYVRVTDCKTDKNVWKRTPLLCSDERCGRVLSYVDQLLCTRRVWSFGAEPPQSASYVNGVVRENIDVLSAREERLMQGRFIMADLYCKCGKQVGYKFCKDLSRDLKNINQVGRYGLVISCLRIGPQEP